MYYYFMVLKKCQNLLQLPDENYYLTILALLLEDVNQIYCTYEYDTKNILHCNVIFSVDESVDYSLLIYSGCHIHIQAINNKSEMYTTMIYIHKDYELKLLPHQMI